MGWREILNGSSPRDHYGVSVLKDSSGATLAAPVSSFKPHVDRGEMAVTAILTTDTPDRQGDVVDPHGGELDEHRVNPVVMFHHGKTHKLPLGKAEDRNGNYTVRPVDSQDGPVLVGTTHFAQSNRFASDVFGLIAEDILRGVSIGFDPLAEQDSVEELGPSPVLKRPALHFKGWKLLEYSHTPIGVNRDALTVKVQKSLEGSEKLHPLLEKLLTPYAKTRNPTVTGGYEASNGKAGMAKIVGRVVPIVQGTLPPTKTKPAAPPPVKPKKVKPVADETEATEMKADGCAGMPTKQRQAVQLDKARKSNKRVPPRQEKAMPDDDEDDFGGGDDNADDMPAPDEEDTDTGNLAAEDGDDDFSGAQDAGFDPTEDDPSADPNLPDTGYNTPGDDEPPPTVQTITDGAQGLMDICRAIEHGMQKSEHMKGRKYAAKLCMDLRSVAGEMKQFADKVHAELSGSPMGTPSESDMAPDEITTDKDQTADQDAGEPVEPPLGEGPPTDEDGQLVTKGYAPRRWTYADLTESQPAPQPAAPSTRELKALREENARLERLVENMLSDQEAAQRRNR